MDRSLADRNYAWFEANLPELVKKHDNRYIVIKDEKVLNSYPSFDEAFSKTSQNEAPGSFLIQLCSMDKGKTVQRFHTMRVRFA